MQAVPALPRQVKVVDSATLLELERVAAHLSLNQRLDVEWIEAFVAAEGGHYLWPALWNVHPHRMDPELVRHLRCQLLLRLRTGEQVLSLLDMRLADFDPLPSGHERPLLPGPVDFTAMRCGSTRSAREAAEGNGSAAVSA